MAALRGPILIVEDDPDIRESLQHFLELHGYPVCTAHHGKAGLEQLERSPRPSLVVLDMTLPIMDGHRLLTARKADSVLRAVPVIILSAAMTGMNPRDRALYGASYEVATFLGKPVDSRQLLDAIERHALKSESALEQAPV
jgi:CheY-like chemotaxis protein